MNERIKKLIVQSDNGQFHNCKFYPHLSSRNLEDWERFAELIVKECAAVCYDHSEAAGGKDTIFGFGYLDCGNDIKRHFGVE